MNALELHRLLDSAYKINLKHESAASRALVLELLEAYNQAAAKNPDVYIQMKNISNNPEMVWICHVD